MDDQLEHQRRQEDEEFWEEKQRESSLSKQARPRDFTQPISDTPSPMRSMPDRDGAPVDAGMHAPETPVFREPAKPRTREQKSNMGTLSVIALLVLGALGYQGYRMWHKDSDTLPTESAAQLAPIVAGSVLPPVLAPSSDPVESVDALAPTAGAPTALQENPEPDAATLAIIEQNERLDRLEARLNEVIEGLRAQGYIIGEAGANGQPLIPAAFAPRIVSPAPAPARRAPVHRPKPKAPVAKALPPVTRQQLLSVDMWDGRPSVVLGNGDSANPQVKVMQPGDSFNGITLKAVDVQGQRATFSDGARSMALGVTN
ncbi:hypothetical protein LPB72_10320 [Hydrogenophaga crassostreae]|uniref:Type IV pilus biogenesis protein PilP n=1 Tax=Hydrogenophaga crassostreae TaxID=1763535 RepID=A0A167HT79_9BURK|nr:hypothetical protein [Hydrogenophaga crassostreae]AOW13415.1 hypothetical protein LPB072_11700 [Hydrogenophaga crassostreae]OAD41703.1 hypothetical protein LPB72_10320 [Hydrogenophaga crassostreae]